MAEDWLDEGGSFETAPEPPPENWLGEQVTLETGQQAPAAPPAAPEPASPATPPAPAEPAPAEPPAAAESGVSWKVAAVLAGGIVAALLLLVKDGSHAKR